MHLKNRVRLFLVVSAFRSVTIVPIETRDVSGFSNEVPRASCSICSSSALRRIRHALHLFGRFKFEIFAEITVAPGDRDLLRVLRDFLLHQLFVFGSCAFPSCSRKLSTTRPFRRLRSLRACDHAFQLRINS